MKKINILITASVVALLSTGCVKPTQNTQEVYTEPVQPQQTTSVIYEEAQPIVYEGAQGTTGTIYEEIPADSTVITTGDIGQPVNGTLSYPDPYANGSSSTTGGSSFPDPYANSSSTGGASSFPDPYSNQPTISDYPATSSYPSSTASAGGETGGIHLQIAALKNYNTAEDYKNRLSLAPGLSAYVQRGAVNKVIVTGIPSVSEANRLKETRFPGAFIIQGGTSGGYTPSVQPNYSTSSGGAYSINNPYAGSSSSSNINSGIGVQVGAFASEGKAQSVANSKSGSYPAIVKKIGRYYKVILTGFASRSAAKAHASRVGGFVVSLY